MRLALLCDDANVVLWLDAIADDPTHELSLAATLNPGMAELLRGRSGIRLTNHWEELLGSREIDAILVGGSDPQILDAIRQFAAASQPLLFLPQADQGSTYIYELSLVRDDNHVLICPAFWHHCDQALIRLREQIRSGSLGPPRLLQFDRIFQDSGTSGLVSLARLDRAQLHDFDLLRWLVGDYDQVTALRTGATPDGVITQSVKLAGRQIPESTWSGIAGAADSCRITIHAENGRAQLEYGPGLNEWVLVEADGQRAVGSKQTAVRQFLDQLAKSLPAAGSNPRSNLPAEWPELVKAFETVDATHRSVTRRRTIELHFEPMSERAIFKTQMTAIGCGVLVGTFLLSLAYLAIASTIPLPHMILLILRSLVFAPLVIFLLLQILYPLARPSTNESTERGAANSERGTGN